MVQELERIIRCDLCRPKKAATHPGVVVKIGSKPRRQLDLCDHHHAALIQPLLDALAEHGADPRTGERPPSHRQNWKRKVGPFLCKAGCEGSAPLRSAATLETHLRLVHDGLTLADYVATHGELVPLTVDELADLVVEVRCQIDDCGQLYSTALGHRWPRQALRSHQIARHGIAAR